MKGRDAIRRAGLALLAALWLAGCDGTNTPTYAPPTREPLRATDTTAAPRTPVLLQTATPTRTATPTPIPTATATPTPTPTCTDAHGRVETGSYFSRVLGRDLPLRVYLPPCYGSSDRRYPVLYLLHGYPFGESHWDLLGADDVADDGIRSAAYPPFIIVMPNCDTEGIFVETSGGDSSVEGLIVDDLVPAIDAAYLTWAEREGRAIGGVSRGAVWSLEIGFRRPDLFSVVGAHSPALAVNYPHPLYDPLILATDPGVQELRIWLDAGDEDWARGGAEQLHRVLEEAGVPHEYTVGEGEHVNPYWSQMLPAYLAFYAAGWPRP